MEEKKRGRKKKEQVENNPGIVPEKKKRGRKKKWEIETCRNILNPSDYQDVVSFSQEKEETQYTDNYDSQQISFGNLNIVVHTNKDIPDINKLHQTLIDDSSINDCKIDISDSEDDYILEDKTNKIYSTIKHSKTKTLVLYDNIHSSGK